MKLASTTLTGNNEAVIGDALRSVIDWVDLCIVIDTGVTDSSLDLAREIAGKKLVVERFEWASDFAQARNFALDVALKHGAHWALTVDTDERIVKNGEDLRRTLFESTAGVVLMPDERHNYVKERAFKLPSLVRFEGPTHESFPAHKVGTVETKGSYFVELPKDAETIRRKFERDVLILEPYVRNHPREPRWHYYLGDSLKNLGRFEEAIVSYKNCADLHGWDEEAAWACFRAAQCHEELGQFQQMVDVLCVGMARHAGLAELPWYAAYASGKLGKHRQAIYWAQLAITWGLYAGNGEQIQRIGFRHLPGLFEGPYDVLRFSHAALGDKEAALVAENDYQKAKATRLALNSEG